MLTPKQQDLYDIIQYFTPGSFVEYILNDKIDYEETLHLIRKAILSWKSLPHYITPLKWDEYPVAQSIKDNHGSKGVDQLNDEEFIYLTLLAFRAHLQYFYE